MSYLVGFPRIELILSVGAVRGKRLVILNDGDYETACHSMVHGPK